jgi:hypothetical protein
MFFAQKEAAVCRPRVFCILLLITSLAGSLLLAACGDKSDGDEKILPPSTVITLEPEPLATVRPGCEAADLEAWYEVASTLINQFVKESKDAVTLAPGDMPPVVTRLTDLRDAIADHPTPECALSTHSAILLHARTVLSAFEHYANGDITREELRSQVDSASQEIETGVAAMLAGLQSGLEVQLEQERTPEIAVPQPPPTPGP